MAKLSKNRDPNEQAPEMALRLLARREHSRLELALKLRQRRVGHEVIERVLDEFEDRGWLSDERFAEVFVRQRMEAGYGPLKILADLQQRGIPGRPPALSEIPDDDWIASAVRLRDRRFGLGNVLEDWPERQRQGGFLARRGFSTEQVEAALEAISASGD
ncbi:regulatory protein [Marinobacter daqiaonensis]|uniref:Regulatory protein RecX n=1 Tax=Marinobacter daqiaonensis TaxID=650891 RepID=A0A1I6JIH1_9GAMM|nr:regulatory protein RecX [Marinobacter daqiaonensis]SFR78721.1 regulatory protein [Marinobacter daqiaonensis]